MTELNRLSPEALGTLRALGTRGRLHNFAPETGEELVRHGYAFRDRGQLNMTSVGQDAYLEAMAALVRRRPPPIRAP